MATTDIALQRIAAATKRLEKAEQLLQRAWEQTFRVGSTLSALSRRRQQP